MSAEALTELISKRLEEAFVGQPVADVSAALVKSYLEGIMRGFLARGSNPVVDLIQYSIAFQGSTMHVIMEPKKGLSDADHSRAVNFLFNQEFY